MNMDCVLCGKFAKYVTLDAGTGELAGVPVSVSVGDPVCMDCLHTLPMKDRKNKYVRVDEIQKIEPGKISIGGRQPK